MINPYEVIMSPNKENIHYSVIGRMSLQDLAEKLSDSLRKEKMKYPKTVIFCRRCVKCVRKYCLYCLGSLYQLKTLIKRNDVPVEPAKNMNSAEAFLDDILTAYIIAGACEVLNIKDARGLLEIEDNPTNFDTIGQLAQDVVKKFTDLTSYGTQPMEYADEVNQYTKDTITLGLIWAAFHDATREGDGERIVDIWRHLLLIFRLSGRTNYAQEAATLLTQLEYLVSPRMKYQMMYSRFVNVHGQIGKNVPCDLHMEHLNR